VNVRVLHQARRLFALLPEEQHARIEGTLATLDDVLLTWRGGLWFALGAAVFALAFALISQYGFGYKPCVLCLWQRLPYLLTVIVAATGLGVTRFRLWRGALLLLCAALFLTDAGIAAFHIGVEQHWWSGTSGCTIQTKAVTDASGLRSALLASPVAQCGEISWTFIGLSMATWNLFFALCCAIFTALIVFFGKPELPQPRPYRFSLPQE